MSDFYFLSTRNPDKPNLKPTITEAKFKNLENDFKDAQSLLLEYKDCLLLDLLRNNNFESNLDFWNRINRHQQMLWTFTTIDNRIQNGGIEGVLWESYEYIFAVIETWEAIGQNEIKLAFYEILSTILTQNKLVNILNKSEALSYDSYSSKRDDEKKLQIILKLANEMEISYHDMAFREDYYNSMVSFVKENHLEFSS